MVEKQTDIASTLMARDYKGFGNQGQTGVLEPIIFDGYNGRVPQDQDCVGTLTTNCGASNMRGGVQID